mgnify:CR=1 FL=1
MAAKAEIKLEKRAKKSGRIAEVEQPLADSAGIRTLAPVQRRTLEYLKKFMGEHGFMPSLREICEYIGVKSPSTAHFHMGRLEEKGFISRNEDGSYSVIEAKEMDTALSSYSVPLRGVIAAGSPIEAIEDSAATVDVPPQFFHCRGEIFCLQVTGDSMIGAHICDGDLILVRKAQSANDGDIVVALLEDGTATLKTFRRLKGGKVMLVPHNPNHQPITLDKVDIQGVLVGLMREL